MYSTRGQSSASVQASRLGLAAEIGVVVHWLLSYKQVSVELVLAKGAVSGVRGDCLGRFLELSTCSGIDGSGTESLSPDIGLLVSKVSKHRLQNNV